MFSQTHLFHGENIVHGFTVIDPISREPTHHGYNESLRMDWWPSTNIGILSIHLLTMDPHDCWLHNPLLFITIKIHIIYIYYIYIQCICPITVHYISRYAAICPLNPYHCDGWYLAPFFISSLTKSHHCIPTCVGILYHYLPSLNQTWQWPIHNVRMIFKSINLHWVGRFSSLPRLITRW